MSRGDYERALADLDQCLKLDPDCPCALKDRAWVMATCPLPKYRDGARAVALASRACDLSRWKIPIYLQVLAAAHAENGDYAKAVAIQETAMLAIDQDDEDHLHSRDLLNRFKARRPWRDPDVEIASKTGQPK